MSFDTAADNARFAEAQHLPFPLLCDVDRELGLAYRACETARDAYPRRITYVIDKDGRIEQAIATGDPGGQAAALLAPPEREGDQQ